MTHSITPGKLLFAAREARGFSQEDIAKRLRLSVQAIQDIERDEFAQIGVRTFVRGYLSNYARLVNISDTQVLEALDASGLMASDAHSTLPRIEGAPVMNVTHQRTRAINLRWIMIGLGALLLITLIAIFHGSKEETIAKNTKNNAPVLTLSEPVVATPSTALPSSPQPAVVATAEKKQHHATITNGFVRRPKTALHTTYTVTPAN